MCMTKKELRNQYRKIRSELNREILVSESRNVCQQICTMDAYLNADAVFVYLSFGDELMTDEIIRTAFYNHKTVAVPKIVNNTMYFGMIQPETVYRNNRYGIAEPVELQIVVPEAFSHSLLILPGLCYDKNNGRIGYGGGYYDRYIAEHKECFGLTVISAALSCQYYSGVIPMETYDIRPDFVVYPRHI